MVAGPRGQQAGAMTTTPPEAPSGAEAPRDQGPRVTRDEIRDLGRLRRSVTDRKVAGVAGGLARHLDIDPVILRVAFVVLVFFGGAGLILYGACWLFVPEEGSDSAPLHLDDRSRTVALVISGILAAAVLVGHSFGGFPFPWPLALVAVVALILLTRRDASRTPPPPPPAAPQYGEQYGAHFGAPVAGPPTAEAAASPYAAAAPTQPAYPPAYPPAGWATTTVAARPPRRRGPILFWFTLALIVLSEGLLGIIDVAGVSVPGSAYPALSVAITGLMLLVGAFWGRAGGLILLGLVSTVALAGATASDHWNGSDLHASPAKASAVRDSYTVSGGELVLDLSHVRDVSALDGRTIHVSGDIGRLEVVVPATVDTTAHADINGPGDIRLFGRDSGGIGIAMTRESGPTDAPAITINADLEVGQIEVHQR